MYIYISDFSNNRRSIDGYHFLPQRNQAGAHESQQYIAQNPSINYLPFINAKSIVFVFF